MSTILRRSAAIAALCSAALLIPASTSTAEQTSCVDVWWDTTKTPPAGFTVTCLSCIQWEVDTSKTPPVRVAVTCPLRED